MIEHGKYQGNSKANEKYPGYHEDYKRHVYDILCQTAQCQAEEMCIRDRVTDVIDDMEVKNHTRDDGTVYGMYSFARKIGQAIAGGLSGWALGWIGYDELATSQTQEVANGIYNLSTFFPAIIYALCGLALLLIYPLSKAKVEANVKELESRRK